MSDDMKYIQKINHKNVTSYNIRKWIKEEKKMVFFGAFPTLQEAITYRDYLIDNNWDTSLIHKPPLRYIHFHKGKYSVEPVVDNKRVYVGRFNTLEDALYERDKFLEADCCWDAYVEATDDTIDGKSFFLQGKVSTKIFFETGPRNDIGIYNHCIKRRY